MTDQNVIGSLRWDLSFFDGIGGASEALRRINNNVLLTLNWDMDTDCTQFVTQKFSSVPTGDLAKSDIEQVAQRIDVAVQERQYVMVITAGPPCPDFSRIRETPKGTDGNSGWLFQHMLEAPVGGRTSTSQTLSRHSHRDGLRERRTASIGPGEPPRADHPTGYGSDRLGRIRFGSHASQTTLVDHDTLGPH